MPGYRNLHDALPTELSDLIIAGNDVPSRVGWTIERLHHTVTFTRPRERFQFHPDRADNPFAKVAESLWVLAGRDDVGWLAHYLPRAPEFSDNGISWRAGYGPRLRTWPGAYQGHFIDQLYYVAEMLRADPGTRRAVLALWDPARDLTARGSKDYPCNNWLHFLIRDGKLHLAATVRSQDVWWGWSGINTFEWSVLQEAMAFWVGAEVGRFTNFASSWHLYERHQEVARKVSNSTAPHPYATGYPSVAFATPIQQLDGSLNNFFRVEAQMRAAGVLGVDLDSITDPFLHSAAQMLLVYNELKKGANRAALDEYLVNMGHTDFRYAAELYVDRHFAKQAEKTGKEPTHA